MTTPSHADPTAPTGLLKAIVDEEPAMAGAAASWLLASTGDLLVHYHLAGPVEWSATTQVLMSPVAGVILLIIGWLVRCVVASPKTQRFLQASLDAARAEAAKATADAAAASRPLVVQLDGRTIAAAIAERPPESVTKLDGLPPVELPPAAAVPATS